MNRSPLATLLITALCLGTAACASTAQDVTPKRVPMTVYNKYECKELASEYRRVSQEADSLSEQIDQGLLSERVKMGVGVVLFWPALLLIDNQSERHQQLASLKGERKTLSESLKARNCPPGEQRASQPRQVLNAASGSRLARL